MERIASRQNPVVKQFRAAAEGSGGRMLLDGSHLLEDAIAAGLEIEIVALVEGDSQVAALGETAARRGSRLVAVTSHVLDAISPVRQPSGIVAIARRPSVSLDDALAGGPQLVLMLSEVQDPGNVGAVIRAAEACGATGLVTSAGTADPFGPKALRGSMGSAFRLPIASPRDLVVAVEAARVRGLRVYAAVPRGGTPLPACNFREPGAVLLGSEGAGLPRHLIACADAQLTIPMAARVESLNVATAAALIVYEAQRQRVPVSSHS